MELFTSHIADNIPSTHYGENKASITYREKKNTSKLLSNVVTDLKVKNKHVFYFFFFFLVYMCLIFSKLKS